MNDSALVEGLRRHDPEAVRYLTETCVPSVWRFVYVRVKADRHLAEDLVSESVLALLKAVADPTVEIGSPLGWLRTVVSNKVADHFRAAARVQHLIDRAMQTQPVADTGTPAEKLEVLEQCEEIRRILELLPEQVRIVLEWKYIDRISVRQISERLGVTEKAVESLLFRGRKEFRERLLRQQASHERAGPVARGPSETELPGWGQQERTIVPVVPGS